MWSRTKSSLIRVLNPCLFAQALVVFCQRGCRSFLRIIHSTPCFVEAQPTHITRITTSIAGLFRWIEMTASTYLNTNGQVMDALGLRQTDTNWANDFCRYCIASVSIFHRRKIGRTPRWGRKKLHVTVASSCLRITPASDWVKMADHGILRHESWELTAGVSPASKQYWGWFFVFYLFHLRGWPSRWKINIFLKGAFKSPPLARLEKSSSSSSSSSSSPSSFSGCLAWCGN